MAASQQQKTPILRLPHPFLTTYSIPTVATSPELTQKLTFTPPQSTAVSPPPLPARLHNDTLVFTEPLYAEAKSLPSDGDNSSWARARRAPCSKVSWGAETPTVGQLWLVAYAIVTLHPLVENFRIELHGPAGDKVGQACAATGLLVSHPPPRPDSGLPHDGFLLLRSCFWQGAGSPFGSRPVWALNLDAENRVLPIEHPPFPLQSALTTQFPATPRHILHPVRAPKPQPGSIIYSRWIPHLNEHFSMVALDYHNQEHLELFHKWQNDPRVAKGWNETGTLDQHRAYLRRLHEDPHVLTILAAFEDVLFAYFEVYWGKEDHLGAHYNADDFDRGRHSLVGDTRFRGPHRVSAWWSGLMHYMFLDEPRTMYIIGEPKATNSTVLAYDFAHGFHIEKLIDLPHKRSAFVRCTREKYFQLSPMVWDGEAAVRPSLDALAKL